MKEIKIIEEFPCWVPSEIRDFYIAVSTEYNELSRLHEISHTTGSTNESVKMDEFEKSLLATLEKNQYYKIFEVLVTDIRMKIVWDRLQKKPLQNAKNTKTANVHFATEMCNVLQGNTDNDEWEKLTPSERTKNHQDLIDDTESLADRLSKYWSSLGVSHLFTNDETENLYIAGDIWYQSVNTPSISELLLRIAKDLKKNPPYRDCLAQRPNSISNKRVQFIRYMARHNTYYYGSPLREILSIITTIFFGSKEKDVSESEIKNALKDFDYSLPPNTNHDAF